MTTITNNNENENIVGVDDDDTITQPFIKDIGLDDSVLDEKSNDVNEEIIKTIVGESIVEEEKEDETIPIQIVEEPIVEEDETIPIQIVEEPIVEEPIVEEDEPIPIQIVEEPIVEEEKEDGDGSNEKYECEVEINNEDIEEFNNNIEEVNNEDIEKVNVDNVENININIKVFETDDTDETDAGVETEVKNKNFGFIITRHVNSTSTNLYWNQNLKLLRTHYPYTQIIVIDDNSNYDLIKPDFDYKNVTYIQSEYIGRGELLPYIYYARNKWFERAVIIHDSTFIHKRFSFGMIATPVLPLWHFSPMTSLHYSTIMKLASKLRYGKIVAATFLSNKWNGCFGCQSIIKHDFLLHIMKKYRIVNLIPHVTCREDRCAMERIMGIIFMLENKSLFKKPSFLYDILTFQGGMGKQDFQKYYGNFKKNFVKTIEKIWTGR
jgi:hypothetical protein